MDFDLRFTSLGLLHSSPLHSHLKVCGLLVVEDVALSVVGGGAAGRLVPEGGAALDGQGLVRVHEGLADGERHPGRACNQVEVSWGLFTGNVRKKFIDCVFTQPPILNILTMLQYFRAPPSQPSADIIDESPLTEAGANHGSYLSRGPFQGPPYRRLVSYQILRHFHVVGG